MTRSSQNKYCYAEKDFTSRELKAILDAVLSSPVIKNEMRDHIEAKLEKLQGPFEMLELKRNWANESYRSEDNQTEEILDAINEAINKGRKIRFQEFTYNVKKERVAKRKPSSIRPIQRARSSCRTATSCGSNILRSSWQRVAGSPSIDSAS